MNERPHTESETEAKIRRALGARAEETIVSPDALESIRNRRSAPRWVRPATYGAVAAVVALIAGIALLSRPDDDGSLDTAVPPTTVPSTTSPPDSSPTTVPPTTAPVTVDGSAIPSFHGRVTFEDRSDDAWVAAPLASSGRLVREVAPYWPTDDRVFTDEDSVSLAYLEEVHGITDPVGIDTVGYDVAEAEIATQDDPSAPTGFRRTSEAGDPLGMGMLIGAAPDDSGNWYIGQVATDRLWIDAVERSDDAPGLLRIRGGGTAFEGTAILTVDGADPVIVAVGATSFEDFSVVVPWDGGEPVRVTLTATSPVAGALPDVVGAVTVPEVVDGELSTPVSHYSVFGVGDDDVLNVRAGAGIDNEIVATLTPDASGIVRTGETADVGSEEWWEISLEDGTGWVNRRFVVANPADNGGADAQLLAMLEALPALDEVPFAEHAFFGGIGVFADFPTPWTSVDSDEFDDLHNWNPEGTDDRNCDCDLTVAEFLGFDTADWDLAEVSIQEPYAPAAFQNSPQDHHFATGFFPDFGDRFVTGAIYILAPNPQVSLDWRHYTVVFDFEDGSPVIRGIYRWGWTP